jgi:hypothetical protein
MNNVIHVDFSKKNNTQEVPESLTAYLDSLREQGIDDEDILDIIDAINDVDSYVSADNVVKEFADGWFNQFA